MKLIYRNLFLLNSLFIAAHVLLFRYLPLRDYPVWVYEGLVFKELMAGNPVFSDSYSLFGYIPPNALSTLFIGSLSFLVHPLAAGKAYVLISILLLYVGIFKFMKLHIESSDALIASFALLCTFNPCFFSGNLNFLFGLGFAFFSLAHIEKKERLNIFLLLPVFFVAYLAHFFSIFILIGYLLIRSFVRRTNSTPVTLAALPVAGLFLHYVLVKDLPPRFNSFSLCSTIDNCSLFRFLSDKAFIFSSWTAPLPWFRWTSELKTAQIAVNLLAVAGYAGICFAFIWLFSHSRKTDTQSLTVFLFSLLVLAMPAATSGISAPGTRLFTFALVNLVAYVVKQQPKFKGAILAFFLILEVLVLSHVTIGTYRFNGIMRAAETRKDATLDRKIGRAYFLDHYEAIRNKEKARVTPTSIIDSKEWTFREIP